MKNKLLPRILCVILCVLLIGSVFLMAVPAMKGEAVGAPAAGSSGIINDDYVNVRSGAGTGASVLTTVNRNTPLTFISGTLYNSEWYNVRLGSGTTGYVHKAFVTVTADPPALALSTAYASTYTGCQYAFGLTGAASATWKSSNTAVATVDSSGVVTAKAAGTTTITATASGQTATATFAVRTGTGTGISSNYETLYVGKTVDLTAASGVSWYSSNSNVASVSNGKVTARASGYATISAYNSSGASTCLVRVVAGSTGSVKLSSGYVSTYAGCQYAFGLTGAASANWSSSNNSVATVDSNGVVTAVSAGTATITANAENDFASATVVVYSGSSTGISSSSVTITTGSTYKLTAASGVNWYSSNSGIAAVNGGTVTAKNPGYATISAYNSGGASTCLVKVVAPAEPKIKLSSTYVSTYVGCRYAFTLTGAGSATWSTSNANIAEINSNGILTAKAAGTVTVSASALGETATATVSIKTGVNTGISSTARHITLGNSYTLTASASGVGWYSSNSNVASVSNGKVTAKATGYATISAYTSNGASTCLVRVTPGQGSTLKLSSTNVSTYTGCQYAFSLTGSTYAEWKTYDSAIATVDQNGIVTAKKAGTTVISATANGETASAIFSVSSGSSTNISATSKEVVLGESFTLTANSGVGWYSSNSNVASVSGGKVTAKNVGYATISAYTSGGASTCLVKVVSAGSGPISLSSSYITTYRGCQYAVGLIGADAASWSTSNSAVCSIDQNGVITANGTGTATIKAATRYYYATATVKVISGSSTGISETSEKSLPVGKSLLLTANSGVNWFSSNNDVASVSRGVVLGKKEGYATISAYTSYGASTCLVHVTAAENVRFVYASPNSSPKGGTVTFKAITDTNRSALRFVVSKGSTSYTVNASGYVRDGNTLVWTGSYKLSDPGKWTVKAYSVLRYTTGYQTTPESGEGEVFVTNSTDTTTTVTGERRASDQIISLIALFEGFLPTLTADYITSDPTIGHGKVIWKNEQFYNNLTRNEAYAYLCQTVNTGGYTTKTNEFLSSNGIKFNQRQFDALVCFAYNVGSYAIFNDSNLKNALLDCGTAGTATIKAGAAGYVNDDYVNLRSTAGTGHQPITTMRQNTEFTFIDGKLYNSHWYYIRLTNGTVGYIYSDYASAKASGGTRDFNSINKNNFIRNLLQYHHASGACYWGLLYRRIDEAEIFFYGDYECDGENNKYGFYFRCSNNSGFGCG